MTPIALTDEQLRQVMEIAQQRSRTIAEAITFERIAADLRRHCDRDGVVGDGDVHRAALAARAAVVPNAAAIAAGALITKSLGP